jgi:hypothetical protein
MEKNDIVTTENKNYVYAVVNNIPSVYRSADLRRFFSTFVETGGFDCFHFRHRPELKSVKNNDSTSFNSEASSSKALPKNNTQTFCCIVRFLGNKFVECMRTYHQRNWQDSKGESMSSKCLISRCVNYF